jgi:hypothetical protein
MPVHDDDFEYPEITDFTGWEVGRYAPKPGEGLDIRVIGAVEYSLRLIPSNKVVGRFASTHEAWPAVLSELDRGIPARLLVLDWHGRTARAGESPRGGCLRLSPGPGSGGSRSTSRFGPRSERRARRPS